VIVVSVPFLLDVQAMQECVAFLDRCIDQDQERLADFGSDRGFSTFTRLMDSLFSACKELTMSTANAVTQVCNHMSGGTYV